MIETEEPDSETDRVMKRAAAAVAASEHTIAAIDDCIAGIPGTGQGSEIPFSGKELSLASANYEAQVTLFDTLAAAAAARGITVTDLAEQLGVTVEDAALWLTGEANLTLTQLRHLANALGAQIVYRVRPNASARVAGLLYADARELPEYLKAHMRGYITTQKEAPQTEAGQDVEDVPKVASSIEEVPWFQDVLDQAKAEMAAVPESSWPSWYREYRQTHNS